MTSDELKKLKKLVENLVKRVETLEQVKRSEKSSSTNSSKLQKLMTEQISSLKPQDLVVQILYAKPKQTKAEIQNKFQSLGATKKMINWFSGGNFRQRLMNKGFVFEDGKNESGKNLYSLTEGKGVQKALSIIEKLQSNN